MVKIEQSFIYNITGKNNTFFRFEEKHSTFYIYFRTCFEFISSSADRKLKKIYVFKSQKTAVYLQESRGQG